MKENPCKKCEDVKQFPECYCNGISKQIKPKRITLCNQCYENMKEDLVIIKGLAVSLSCGVCKSCDKKTTVSRYGYKD